MRFTAREEDAVLSRSGLRDVLSDRELASVKACYSDDPARRYHDWAHALSVLDSANDVCDAFPEPQLHLYTHRDVRLAALFHDVVYDVAQGSPANEVASVRFMQSLQSLSGTDVWGASAMIGATALHGKLEQSDVAPAVALFLDCDIASLGEQRWDIFLWNDRNIVYEFTGTYAPEQVAVGRKAFLEGLLAKGSIFLSDYFRARLEDQARANITRILREVYG